jgi:hypothetical protein
MLGKDVIVTTTHVLLRPLILKATIWQASIKLRVKATYPQST